MGSKTSMGVCVYHMKIFFNIITFKLQKVMKTQLKQNKKKWRMKRAWKEKEKGINMWFRKKKKSEKIAYSKAKKKKKERKGKRSWWVLELKLTVFIYG